MFPTEKARIFAACVLREVEAPCGHMYHDNHKSFAGLHWLLTLSKANDFSGNPWLRATVRCPDDLKPSWSAVLEGTFTLERRSACPLSNPFEKQDRQVITRDQPWTVDIMEWKDLLDPNNKFFRDRIFSCTLEFRVVNMSEGLDPLPQQVNPIISTDQSARLIPLVKTGSKRKLDHSTPSPLTSFALIVDGKKIFIGKEYLSVHSPVFEAMFFGEFAEKNKTEIEIKDVCYEDFMTLLSLIYPTNEPLEVTAVDGVLSLADRFAMESVTSRLESFLVDSSVVSISQKLLYSEKYRLSKLKDHSLALVNKNSVVDLRKTPEYEQLSDSLKVLLMNKYFDE